MFTPDERERLRVTLVSAARADKRITGAALTGSAARDAQDAWSDIDLAFGVGDSTLLRAALDDWTKRMVEEHGAVATVDVTRGNAVYRVFFLRNTLQVDLAFFPASEFGALAPTFRLLFGESVQLAHVASPSPEHLIGMAWLHAIHARSCIKRGKHWQAEYMISGVRDHVLALAASRLGLPPAEGRGMDQLPQKITRPLEAALVRTLDARELSRAFAVVVAGLLSEVHHADHSLAARLEGPLIELTAP